MSEDHDRQVLEEIFTTKTQDPTTSSAEGDWAYGRSNYKPFRTHYLQCRKSGNLDYERCHCCGRMLLICKRYGGQCSSGKCRKDRTREGGDNQCTLF